LLLDLLTAREEQIDLRTRHLRFDIDLLATRLMEATNWAGTNREIYDLPIAYFGASTGAAAALISAANLPGNVKAVVSRGGRPDLAASSLSRVRAPTLLILGGKDTPVIDLNRKALDELQCEKELKIVPGASHLFEEPGTLEQVSSLASEVINNIQQQAIRNLAYELWQQRGCRQGSPEEDWYRAEQILQAARTQSALGSR
jgi:putative phosphoribosyl transferase